MDNRQIIQEELRQVHSALADMPAVNPFEVPEQYFENFPHQMLGIISLDDEILPELANLKHPAGFVPGGYFEALPSVILNRVKQSGEDSRAEIARLSPVLADISRTMPYAVPEDYFQTSVELYPEIRNAEDAELSPELISLRNKTVYQVPSNYFGQLPQTILKKINGRGAKVISMNRFSTFKKFAIAAIITGIVFTGAWFLNDQPVPAQTDMVNIDDISLEELESFSEGRPSIAVEYAGFEQEEGELNEQDFREFFADMSDQELQHYLTDYSGIPVEMSN